MSSRVRILVGAAAGAIVAGTVGVGVSSVALGVEVSGSAAATITALPPAAPAPEGTSRYLVRYVGGTDVAAEARSLRSQGVAVRRTFSYAVRGAAITTTPAKAAALARSPRVEVVEPDGIVRVSEAQRSAPWGLDRADQRALPLSTDYTAPSTGAGVTAYVVDTGILGTHEDFGARVASGWTAIDDANGTSDCNGHGTHVAGTVAGATYGIAKAVELVPVRVLDCDGSGYMSDVVAGLDWAVRHHAAGVQAVMNLSLGGSASSVVDAAVRAVIDDGITAVVAAGNESTDACTTSPARVRAAITVAATDRFDRQAPFSNHGTCVDLYAPGVSISSTWHTSTVATKTLSGTSMASPHAAGAAALLIAQGLASTPAQVAGRLTSDATTDVVTARTTDDTPDRLLFVAPQASVPPASPEPVAPEPAPTPGPAPAPEPVFPYDPAAPDAPTPADPPETSAPSPTTPATTTPSAPTRVSATARTKAVRVTWTQVSTGGSALTGQSIRVYVGGRKIRAVAVSTSATRYTVRRLKPGVSYRFTITTRNAVGRSPESARSKAVKPRR